MHPKQRNAIGIYLEGIRDGNIEEALDKYTGARYTQHNAHVKDGRAGFVEFFTDFIERNPKRDIQIVRSLVDGDYVFCHAYQNLNEGEAQWITMDFFLTDENDKLIEHWDTIAAYTPHTPSGHTSIDGATEVTDLDKTEANKTLVRNLITEVLMPGGDPSKIDQYISAEQYIQHHSAMSDGIEAFRKSAMGPNRPLNYQEIFLMVGQGNFVATLSKTNRNDGNSNQDYAQADLFRVENDKIVEHWDCVEAILPREEWVNSGKF